MPRIFTSILLVAVFIAATAYAGFWHGKRKPVIEKQAGGNAGFALVELFTSEGCSSCPPADDALAQLLNTGKKNVYVLGFHVDYWNSLGWKDAYSNALFSTRQQQYGSIFKLNSIYTPQAVVNGATEFTGSDTRRLDEVVEKSLNQPAENSIGLTAKMSTANTVNVTCKLQKPLVGGAVLNVALVQLHAASNVQRGENRDKVLNHVNVVRDFKTVNSSGAAGIISLQIPAGLTAAGCKIIAFTQYAAGKTTGAAETEIVY